jgi:hypothetical protein
MWMVMFILCIATDRIVVEFKTTPLSERRGNGGDAWGKRVD